MYVKVKRIYATPDTADGTRILVDRLWPRGMSKKDAQLDGWWKDIAPSDELRNWFHHAPEKWEEFKVKYKQELEVKAPALKNLLSNIDSKRPLTLLYGSKDEHHNQAHIIKEFITDLHL